MATKAKKAAKAATKAESGRRITKPLRTLLGKIERGGLTDDYGTYRLNYFNDLNGVEQRLVKEEFCGHVRPTQMLFNGNVFGGDLWLTKLGYKVLHPEASERAARAGARATQIRGRG